MKTGPALVRIVKEATNPWYEITLVEGRNRQIRRMFETVGHHVEKIKRVRYGPLTLDVPPGKFRSLTLKEVERLKAVSTAKAGNSTRTPRAPRDAARNSGVRNNSARNDGARA